MAIKDLGRRRRDPGPGRRGPVAVPRPRGLHIGSLWTAGGAKLASVTFTNESPAGWQQASFTTPVIISADVHYRR
ncbi:DUF4082 domain-containing protein [Microbispora sp. NPDC004025]